MIPDVDITPAGRDDARRRGNSKATETLYIPAARPKKIPSALYELIDVKVRTHIALKQIPFGDYTLSNYD